MHLQPTSLIRRAIPFINEIIWKQRPRAKFLQPTLFLTQNVHTLFLVHFSVLYQKKNRKVCILFFFSPFFVLQLFFNFFNFLVCAISFFFSFQVFFLVAKCHVCANSRDRISAFFPIFFSLSLFN